MDIARQFELACLAVKANTEGMTHADSVKAPAGGGNCLNWVLGHIVTARNMFFPMIGLDPIWTEPRAQYGRGSAALDPADAVPLGELLADYAASQEPLLPRLRELDDATLARPLPSGPDPILGETVGSALTALAFHESYHAGQVGLLRRLAGKDGAIR